MLEPVVNGVKFSRGPNKHRRDDSHEKSLEGLEAIAILYVY